MGVPTLSAASISEVHCCFTGSDASFVSPGCWWELPLNSLALQKKVARAVLSETSALSFHMSPTVCHEHSAAVPFPLRCEATPTHLRDDSTKKTERRVHAGYNILGITAFSQRRPVPELGWTGRPVKILPAFADVAQALRLTEGSGF